MLRSRRWQLHFHRNNWILRIARRETETVWVSLKNVSFVGRTKCQFTTVGYPRRRPAFQAHVSSTCFRKQCSFPPPLNIFTSTSNWMLYINIYFCYTVFSQVSITVDLKANVKGQVKLKHSTHSSRRHLKPRRCVTARRAEEERSVLPWSV